MSQLIHFAHFTDTLANIISGIDDGQSGLNSTDNRHIHRIGGSIFFPANGKKYVISGATYTYLDEIFNDITAEQDVIVNRYISHLADTTTRLYFQNSRITMSAGGVDFLDMFNTTQDILSINPGNVDIDTTIGALGATALTITGSDKSATFSGNIILPNAASISMGAFDTGSFDFFINRDLFNCTRVGITTAFSFFTAQDRAGEISLINNYYMKRDGSGAGMLSTETIRDNYYFQACDGEGGYADKLSGAFIVGKELDFSIGANQASYMAWSTLLNGTLAEKMRLNSSGQLLIGATSELVGDADAGLQIVGEASYHGQDIICFSDTAAHSGYLDFYHSYSDMQGTKARTLINTVLGGINFYGVNNAATKAYAQAASIAIIQPADSGSVYVPADMVISLGTDAVAAAEALRITSNKYLQPAGRVLGVQGADVASGTWITLGNGNTFLITGTTAVSGFLDLGWTNGSIIILTFNGNCTLTDSAAPGGGYSALRLLGAANVAMTANDMIILVKMTNYWHQVAPVLVK